MNNYIPIRSLAALVASCFLPLCCLAQSPSATKSLWDEFLDVTEKRLKTTGPDYEIAQFISMARESAWARRETFFTLSRSYLDDPNGAKVSAAIEVYLEDVALKDPEPQGKSARPLDRIKQFVADYLASYVGVRKDASSKEDIAAQLRKARLLLCDTKR